MQFFTVAKLSPHMDWTPEGYLLCKDVPIARTGTQLYRENEVPNLDADDDGWISVDREPSEVFHPDSLASFLGKPVTNDHPDDIVTPDNHDRLAIGTILDVRRGENSDHDLLFADLLFTSRKGIDLVRRGKRAVSVGYDADYERVGRGQGRQRAIRVNHLALVDEGRCGARCTIMDGKPLYNPEVPVAHPVWRAQMMRAMTADVHVSGCGCDACLASHPARPGWHDDIDFPPMTIDAEFNEADHPRVAKGQEGGGQFTAGGGGASAVHKGSQRFGETGSPTPPSLNGVKFEKFEHPEHNDGWEFLAKVGPKFTEPAMPALPPGKTQSAGVIIKEPDGRVWVIHPTNAYGGYKGTFPKGGVEPGMTARGTAIKEAAEESGMHVQLTGYAGDAEGTTTMTRYYHARRIGGDPADHHWETEGVTLSPVDELHQHLNRSRDRNLAADVLGAPMPAPKVRPQAAPVASIADWAKVGGQLGSNPGAQMLDEEGQKHYVKFSKSEAHARNEVLAARLYEAAGSPIVNSQLVDIGNGKVGVATRWMHDRKDIDQNDPAQRKLAQEHFATHAWLANWDAAGLEYDNQAMAGGKMTTMDPGGSLIFRAQGGPKGDAFGDKVGEWDTLRSPSNAQAHKVFGEMNPAQLKESAQKVAAVPSKTIRDLTMEHGPGTEEQRKALADRIIARRNDVAKRAGLQTADAWTSLAA